MNGISGAVKVTAIEYRGNTKWIVCDDGTSFGGGESSTHDLLAVKAGYRCADLAYKHGWFRMRYTYTTDCMFIESWKWDNTKRIAQVIQTLTCSFVHLNLWNKREFIQFMGAPRTVNEKLTTKRKELFTKKTCE